MTNTTAAAKKRCSKCKRTVSVKKFRKEPAKPDGLSHWCAECISSKDKVHRQSLAHNLRRAKEMGLIDQVLAKLNEGRKKPRSYARILAD